MKTCRDAVLTSVSKVIVALAFALTLLTGSAIMADENQVGNLGYNSYEGYMTGGTSLERHFGSGVGYPAPSGDYFDRYIDPEDWGRLGYGTGHLGMGWGPYIFDDPDTEPRGMFDPLPPPYIDAPPPKIHIGGGEVHVFVPSDVPGIEKVTVTLLAFNAAELATKTIYEPPYDFELPVKDGLNNVRVRIDYVNGNFSATAYPL